MSEIMREPECVKPDLYVPTLFNSFVSIDEEGYIDPLFFVDVGIIHSILQKKGVEIHPPTKSIPKKDLPEIVAGVLLPDLVYFRDTSALEAIDEVAKKLNDHKDKPVIIAQAHLDEASDTGYSLSNLYYGFSPGAKFNTSSTQSLSVQLRYPLYIAEQNLYGQAGLGTLQNTSTYSRDNFQDVALFDKKYHSVDEPLTERRRFVEISAELSKIYIGSSEVDRFVDEFDNPTLVDIVSEHNKKIGNLEDKLGVSLLSS